MMNSQNRHFLNRILMAGLLLTGFAIPASAQSNPIPLINQPLVPSAVAPGGPAFTLTVNGTGFVSGATVNWNGSPRTTTFVSVTKLTAQITAADIAIATTATITVTNPGSIASNSIFFQVEMRSTSVNFAFLATPVTPSPGSMVSGDFNGDGKLDLAVVIATEFSGDSISILLGNGDGTFTAGTTTFVGASSSYSLLSGDFNGDGKVDLVIVNFAYPVKNSTVSVYLGNGDGTFRSPITTAYKDGPLAVAVGDVNGDGKLDLIVGNYQPGSRVGILLGNGDGTFQPQVNYATAGGVSNIAAGDFNGDGHIDLAVAVFENGLSILIGNGHGTFQAPIRDPSPKGAESITAADLNGDGKLDLIVSITQLTDNRLDILLGNGDGSFQEPVAVPIPEPAGLVLVGDFNADSRLDLAFVSGSEPLSTLYILPGRGDGTFQPVAYFPLVNYSYGLVSGDFNGDGMLDFATAVGSIVNEVSVLLQTTIVVSASSLSFPAQGVLTTSAPQTFTLTNIGHSAIPINSFTLSGDSTQFAQTNNCGTSLGVGSTCTVSVTCTPHFDQQITATLTIADGAVGSPQVISLTGTGVYARYTLTPSSLQFGNQMVGTTSAPQTLTLGTHLYNLAINSILLGGINASDFAQTNNCPAVLPQGSACTINVTFTPTVTGTRSASVTIHGGFDGGIIGALIKGTGTN